MFVECSVIRIIIPNENYVLIKIDKLFSAFHLTKKLSQVIVLKNSLLSGFDFCLKFFNYLPKPRINSVNTPGSLSIRHQSPAAPDIFNLTFNIKMRNSESKFGMTY